MKYCPNCAAPIYQDPLARQKKKFSAPCSREFSRKVRPSYRHYKKPFCERCGSSLNLEVHHKNEDIRYNNPENLETLCRSCHGHTIPRRDGCRRGARVASAKSRSRTTASTEFRSKLGGSKLGCRISSF